MAFIVMFIGAADAELVVLVTFSGRVALISFDSPTDRYVAPAPGPAIHSPLSLNDRFMITCHQTG